MRTQRKIVHLLGNNRETGRGFKYLPELNPTHSFDWNELIIITDKIDGTTAQATKESLFKRIDLIKKGDPRKFTASEEERYGLIQLSTKDPQNQWIYKAYNRYRHIFYQKLPYDLVVYFECFGDKINRTYKDRVWDIRVFDFARRDTSNPKNYTWKYLPFTSTIKLCEEYHLPVVGHFSTKFSGVKAVLDFLPGAEHEDSELKRYDLEGWVLRQGTQIAKIRKRDLKLISFKER